VEVVKEIDGKQAKVKETRQPTIKTWQWEVETNKGFTQGKASGANANQPTKRAVTINKRDGQTLKFIGNFQSASKACDYLKINVGGDSATRVLAREGYILDAYTGTDYTE
jgi:hypothetical protein